MKYRITPIRLRFILALLLLLITGCSPFAFSAVIEPNNASGTGGNSFDVSVNVEPNVATLVASTAVPDTLTAGKTPVRTDGSPATAATDVIEVSPTVTADRATVSSTEEGQNAVATPDYPALVAQTGLNIRSGPGTSYAKIGSLAVGAQVQVVGKDNSGEWWQIIDPADRGQRVWITANPNYSQVYNVGQIAVVATPTPAVPRLVINSDSYGANNLMSINLIGGDAQWVYYGGGSDNVYTAVTRDGKRVAFVSDRDGNQEIYTVTIDGSDLTRLTYSPAPDKWPAWSPDGTRIAFDSEQDGNREIYTMNADGSGLFRVTDHWAEDGAPSWSPDGTQLVFHSNRDGNHEIYIINADGSNLRRLTFHSGNDWTPVWSPDGTQIAFMGYHDSQSADIYVMDTNGENLRNLTNHPAEDAVPAWSPNGQQLAFESRRNGNLDVFVINADGSQLRQVTHSAANEGHPAWIAQ